MNLRLSLVLALALLAGASASARGGEPVPITLLHVNDFHGRLLPERDRGDDRSLTGGAALLAGLIRKERGRDPEGTVLLSAGDMFQGTPASDLARGTPVIEFMNAAGFDAMTVGNHEFDWGRDALRTLSGASLFPFLASTIRDAEGRPLPGTVPVAWMERKGIRIAVIGVSTPDTPYSTKPDHVKGLTFLDPVASLAETVKEARDGGAGVVVVLSHLGFGEDRKLAAAVPGIDVILGGHSHTTVSPPARVGQTVVAQAGSGGRYLGIVRLEVDPETNTAVYRAEGSGLLPVTSDTASPDPRVARIVENARELLKGEFRKEIGSSSVDLVRDRDGESNVGNLLCDAMREATGADVAFMNSGGIRADLARGSITLGDVYTLLPFENILMVMKLDGQSILYALERGASLESGMVQVSGLTMRVDLSRPKDERVSEVRIGGEPLDPEKRYRVVVHDFLAAGGDRYNAFRAGADVVAGDDFRGSVLAYLKAHSPVAPKVEGRIRIGP